MGCNDDDDDGNNESNGLRLRKKSKSKKKQKTEDTKHALSPIGNKKTEKSEWSLWSLMPLKMFSFHGTDELKKNEQKRKAMHNEAENAIEAIVNRLKYWIVFAVFEWIYYLVEHKMNFIPFWYHIKFALILYIQLPYVPMSALEIY